MRRTKRRPTCAGRVVCAERPVLAERPALPELPDPQAQKATRAKPVRPVLLEQLDRKVNRVL